MGVERARLVLERAECTHYHSEGAPLLLYSLLVGWESNVCTSWARPHVFVKQSIGVSRGVAGEKIRGRCYWMSLTLCFTTSRLMARLLQRGYKAYNLKI